MQFNWYFNNLDNEKSEHALVRYRTDIERVGFVNAQRKEAKESLASKFPCGQLPSASLQKVFRLVKTYQNFIHRASNMHLISPQGSGATL